MFQSQSYTCCFLHPEAGSSFDLKRTILAPGATFNFHVAAVQYMSVRRNDHPSLHVCEPRETEATGLMSRDRQDVRLTSILFTNNRGLHDKVIQEGFSFVL